MRLPTVAFALIAILALVREGLSEIYDPRKFLVLRGTIANADMIPASHHLLLSCNRLITATNYLFSFSGRVLRLNQLL